MLLNEFEVSSASSCVSVTASSWRMWSFLSPCSSSRWLNPSGHKSSLEKCVHVFEKTLKVQFKNFHIFCLYFSSQGATRMRPYHGVCHNDTPSLGVNSITAVCPSLSLSSVTHTHTHKHSESLWKSAPVVSITKSVGSITTSIKQKKRKPPQYELTLPQALAHMCYTLVWAHAISVTSSGLINQQKNQRTPTHLVSTNNSPPLLHNTF